MPALGSVQFLTIHCEATPEARHVTHQQIANQINPPVVNPHLPWGANAA